MRALGLTLVAAGALALAPGLARAEPITLAVSSATGGFSADPGTFSTGASTIDLGTITLDGGSSGLIEVSGLTARQNYTVTANVVDPAGNPFTSLSVEILDPLSDGFDAADPQPQPDYVPAGYSTSNNTDGLSFAWNSGLDRSATFAGGGSASLFVDEDTNAHDMFEFNGFTGGTVADATFGLRDNLGGRTFLLRFSVNGDPGGSQTPEPASFLLLGTGALALFATRRAWLAC